jgi:DNA mismatch repair ATPase MutS
MNKIGTAEFYMDLSGNSLSIKDQYYPALIDETYVPNDATMDKNMIITGPNAAGKTTYLKTTVINIIFTQQFGCGFYSTCRMKPYTHIHSYLNIPDTSGRDSLFQAESRRCKEILNVINESSEKSRHFGIFDELYSGTNPVEATKSAYSFLLYLSKFENVDYILTTHYVDICSRLTKASTRIENWKMDAKMDEKGDIEYNYTISKGISTIQGAVKVLRDMEYPEEIINTIMEYDNETEIDKKDQDKEKIVEPKKSRKSKK